jgi:cysteine desulfurase
VTRAVTGALAEFWYNPSSIHRPGQAARQRVELARSALADLIHAKPREVILTSGGTESIDLAIRGVLSALPAERRTLYTTRTEHAAVRDLAEELEKSGLARVTWLPVTPEGLVDLDTLRRSLSGGTGLVSIQWANNETGAVQPVREVAAIARERGAIFHCDGTQWVGKEPAIASEVCDLLTFSPHKFHGPKGVGVLWSRPGIKMRPQLLGTQELGRRGGTENVPGIIGAGVAAREALQWLGLGEVRFKFAALRDEFEAMVLGRASGAVVNGPRDHAQRLWNTSNVGFPRLEAEALLLLLSERGVCASAGAACSSGSLDPSPVLLAMGIPAEIAHGSIRFSLSKETTPQELEAAAGIVVECVARLSQSLPRASGAG